MQLVSGCEGKICIDSHLKFCHQEEFDRIDVMDKLI